MSFNQHREPIDYTTIFHRESEQMILQSPQNHESKPTPHKRASHRAEKPATEDSNSDLSKTTNTRVPGVYRSNSSFLNTKYFFFITIFSTATFALVLWYVQAFSAPTTAIRTGQAMQQILNIDIGSALAVLRVTQGALSALVTFGLAKALEMLQWGLTGRVRGLESNVFFALSPATPVLEVFRIVISRTSSFAARVWGLMRWVLLLCLGFGTSLANERNKQDSVDSRHLGRRSTFVR